MVFVKYGVKQREKHRKVWQRFHRAINRYEMYSYNNTELFNNYLNYLGTTPILRARAKSGGTQVKLFLVFADGGEALVKPWRVPRDYETVPDHYYFADIERHNAEISAFHLDRILDFRRVPPNAGRIFNLSRDIYDRADSSLSREFYRSPANNLCFMTDCDQHCDIAETPVCGNPDQIEGSVAAFLPPETSAKRSS
ncbi:putative extracellular serine/threonine protein kinase FAM20C [Apostichopus japonicus]|uniref:Putative extracellular serine/threonine protein kinase FAM20C n=1 Tax=Stichopus japonicus TaxID=307972 RepID=A0A2G8JNB1_STIJA|nr:putative extracellular serine/threonine protein kinase FAM20C [Apostichopus japonicus]